MGYIWKFFIDLHNRRSSNGFGINPILYTDIYSYCQLYNIILNESELDLILELDKIALNAYRLETEKSQKAQAPKK